LQLPAVAGAIGYTETLANYALRYEPRLKKMREEIRRAGAAVEVARKERWPDVSIGLESRNYARNGEWRQAEFMVGFSIPLGNRAKYRADIRREEENRKAAEFETKDFEQLTREEVHGLIVKISTARREAVLYRDQIIPRSEQAAASARAMFESGGALRDLLDARRMLLDARLMFARAVAEQYEMLSELVLCCGLGDLEALQMIAATPETETETKIETDPETSKNHEIHCQTSHRHRPAAPRFLHYRCGGPVLGRARATGQKNARPRSPRWL
jgi:outer membrane protein TolC